MRNVVSGAAASLEVEQRGDGFVRAHQRRVSRVRVRSRLRHGRVNVVAIFHSEPLRMGLAEVSSKALNLAFHLGVLGALPDTLKVGFDLALELQSDTSRARLKRVLNDVASQLLETAG